MSEQRIGPYRIDRRLGLGGMGIVYAAHDEALGRDVALKVISPQLAHDEEFRARFVREARAMASLDSPHVVHVYAHGEDDDQLWIATQLFTDGDLGTLLRRSGPPPLPTALDLMEQVASGLADAHAVGLVHRDIKPANVLLRQRGHAWSAALGDFGIARAATEETGLTSGVIGTPSYMAPELHDGASASVASDVYALGCLLWTTIVGSRPFPATTGYGVARAHLEDPAPQLAGTSPAVAALNGTIARALAKQPRERHGSAAEFRDELAAVRRQLADGASVARAAASAPAGATAPDRARPASRPTRTPLLAALAVLLVVLLAAGAWAWSQRGDGEERADATGSTQTTSAPTPTASSSDPTSSEPTSASAPTSADGGASEVPTPGPDGWSNADRQRARASFVAALRTQAVIDQQTARCIADDILAGDGLQQMVDARFFDADWGYVDHDLEAHPELKTRFTSATLSCAGAL